MRKLIWLSLLLVAVPSLFAAPSRRRSVRHPDPGIIQAQYRGDAGRTGQSFEIGPRFLENIVWERSLQGPVRGLVYDHDVLYAGAFGSVNAVNPETGTDFWVFTQPGVQFSPVAIVGDEVYASGGNTFYALHKTSGTLAWSFTAGASIDKTSPMIVDGVAYVGSSAGVVYAIDLASHAPLWSRNVGSPVRTHLASAQGLIIAVTDGALRALRIQDGAERWSRPGTWGEAVATSTLVYSGLENGPFQALDLETGHTAWSYTDVNYASQAWGPPAVARNVVAFGNANGHWYALDADDGGWRFAFFQTPRLANAAIIGANGELYFGTGTDPLAPAEPNQIYSADLVKGWELSIRFTYGHSIGGPAIAGGKAFYHDSGNKLSAFKD